MMKKSFYFLVFVFCFGSITSVKAIAPACVADSKDCFCFYDAGCQDFSVTDAGALSASQAACTAKTSKYQLSAGKCTSFVGHCDCSPSCISYQYKNGNELADAQLNCKAASCKATNQTFLDGPCPSASTAAPTGDGVKSISLDNPLALSTDIKSIIANIITKVLQIMGALSLMMILQGSTGWISSGGNPEKIESGKKTIMWAVLGVVLTLSSYVILQVIFKYYFGGITG